MQLWSTAAKKHYMGGDSGGHRYGMLSTNHIEGRFPWKKTHRQQMAGSQLRSPCSSTESLRVACLVPPKNHPICETFWEWSRADSTLHSRIWLVYKAVSVAIPVIPFPSRVGKQGNHPLQIRRSIAGWLPIIVANRLGCTGNV